MMLKDRVKKIYSIKNFRKNDDEDFFCFYVLKVFFKLKLFNFFLNNCCFGVSILFWCIDIKNNFFKIKTNDVLIYFYVKKYFEK